MPQPIGDHALLADGRTAALVDSTGDVAWLCWPRVDSAPCLLGILDAELGGGYRVAPADRAAIVVERAYLPGSLVLRTVWRVGAADLTVLDALAWDDPPRLIRELSSTAPVAVRVTLRLAPDAARARAEVTSDPPALRIRGGGLRLALHGAPAWSVSGDGMATAVFQVEPGDGAQLVLADAAPAPSASLAPTLAHFASAVPAAVAAGALAERTLGAATAGRLLRHSAAVLAGLRQRGGGIVAAPTTSLPQWPGSGRTWDYRYSWLRDTALAGTAMLRAGLDREAAALGEFVGAATAELPPAVLLRVDGSPPPAETGLDHLAGYRGSRPVRIGNAASTQPQLDVAGEVLELAGALATRDLLDRGLRAGAARVADWTAAHWHEADHGIWEIRGRARHYTHSRVMAWAGLILAADLADDGRLEGNAGGWRGAAAAIRAAVLDGAGPLTMHDGGGGPDAALAQAALVGFLEPADPRLRATLELITSRLDRGGLIERHLPEEDSSTDPCGPFLFPTFWLAAALDACGGDAARHLAAAAAARGCTDLFGEVADPLDGTPLGNYPQVQSHAAFILAAIGRDG